MIDSISVGVTRWINLMADKVRNTTKKNKEDGEIVETGKPRCKRCFSRLTIVELNGSQKLWCINCDAPFI